MEGRSGPSRVSRTLGKAASGLDTLTGRNRRAVARWTYSDLAHCGHAPSSHPQRHWRPSGVPAHRGAPSRV